MIEAVGERYWPTYFTALDRLLKPGGRVGLQSITMPHDRMLASRGDYSWMHKYVFPGGLIPSVQAIEQHLAAAHDAAGGRAAQPRGALRPHARALAARTSCPAGRPWPRSGSTARSAGCGSSTSPTARRASASATSTSSSSPWRAR